MYYLLNSSMRTLQSDPFAQLMLYFNAKLVSVTILLRLVGPVINKTRDSCRCLALGDVICMFTKEARKHVHRIVKLIVK
jgi:hypothetical protein